MAEKDPEVPKGVIEGIRDIIEGRTASKEEIAEVLKFQGENEDGSTPD